MKAMLICCLLAISVPALAANEQKKEMARRVKERFELQFKEADTDGNGKLTREEAEKSMPYVFRNFDVMDADKDGALTVEEISAHSEVKTNNAAETK